MAPAKLETAIHVKVAAEKFYEVVSVKAYEVTKISPPLYNEGVLLHGEWGQNGSIVFWKYVDAGKLKVAKDVIEEVDRNNNIIAYRVLEGDLSEFYKKFKFIIKVTAEKEYGGSVVQWTLEYEKDGDHVPDPYTLMYVLIELTKDIEYHLLKS